MNLKNTAAQWRHWKDAMKVKNVDCEGVNIVAHVEKCRVQASERSLLLVDWHVLRMKPTIPINTIMMPNGTVGSTRGPSRFERVCFRKGRY